MGRLIDLTGQKFGRLTVLERDYSKKDKRAYWVCRCDCGAIKTICGEKLRSGNTKSCGCLKKELFHEAYLKDLSGQVFGLLTVIKYDEDKRGPQGQPYWICQCECGLQKSIRGNDLKSGKTISCGCFKKSKGEEKLSKLLKENGFNFIQQYKFEDLKGDSFNLFFDFAILDDQEKLSCLLEYQGEQHYTPQEYFGGKERFERQIKYDNLKREYCIKHNIKLVEIPYWDYNKMSAEYLHNKIFE